MDVAQLVRASDCDSEGRGFESRLSPQFYRQAISDTNFFRGRSGFLCIVSALLIYNLPDPPAYFEYSFRLFVHRALPLFRYILLKQKVRNVNIGVAQFFV